MAWVGQSEKAERGPVEIMHSQNRQERDEKSHPESGRIRRVPPGTFRAGPPGARDPDDRRETERPALVMVLAPLLGICIWGAILFLLLA
jgi:hypothetical protein